MNINASTMHYRILPEHCFYNCFTVSFNSGTSSNKSHPSNSDTVINIIERKM